MKQKQMKKYFMQGTAEEVKTGDMIELDLTEDLPNGHVKHHHLECKFIPQLIPLLLKSGVIEVQEVKEKKSAQKDMKILKMIDDLADANLTLISRIEALEKMVKELSLLVAYSPVDSTKSKPHGNAKKAGRK